MSRYTPQVASALAGIPVLTNGQYEFSVGEMKPFSKTVPATSEKPEVTQWGIRTAIKVTATPEGDDDAVRFLNASIPHTLYMHGTSSSMNKQFAMAALGYTLNRENEFNERFPDDADGENYFVDVENNSVGTVWRECVGKRVCARVTSKPNQMPGREGDLQNMFNFFPYVEAE